MTEAAQSTTGGGVTVPTRAELVERAASLRALLEANAAQTETERRVAEENIERVEEAGLFRIMVPAVRWLRDRCPHDARRLGGAGQGLRVNRLDGELDQRLRVARRPLPGAGAAGGVGRRSRRRASQESWRRRRRRAARTAGSRHRALGVGIRLPARTWAVGGVPVVDESGELIDGGLALMPMSELTIEDTWFVAGMKGTGSNTLVAEDVFVPDHRILPVPRAIQGTYPTGHKDEVLYRSAFIPVLALILVGPQLGLASAALELVAREGAAARHLLHLVREADGLRRLPDRRRAGGGAHRHRVPPRLPCSR